MSTITDRQKSTFQIRAANRAYAGPTAATLADLLTPVLAAGERLPDLELLQDLFVRLLEHSWYHLSAAAEVCLEVVERQGELIAERDAAVSRLYREVVDLRRTLKGTIGVQPTALLIGFRGKTSQDPVVLLRQADRATARLRDLDRPLPASRRRPAAGGASDRARWAAPVAAAAKGLRSLVTAVDKTAKQLDAARLERRQALEHFNRSFVAVADWLVATYRVIGRDDRAKAVKPSRRYPGQTDRDAKRRPGKRPARPADTRPEDTERPLAFPHLRPLFHLFGSRRQSS